MYLVRLIIDWGMTESSSGTLFDCSHSISLASVTGKMPQLESNTFGCILMGNMQLTGPEAVLIQQQSPHRESRSGFLRGSNFREAGSRLAEGSNRSRRAIS